MEKIRRLSSGFFCHSHLGKPWFQSYFRKVNINNALDAFSAKTLQGQSAAAVVATAELFFLSIVIVGHSKICQTRRELHSSSGCPRTHVKAFSDVALPSPEIHTLLNPINTVKTPNMNQKFKFISPTKSIICAPKQVCPLICTLLMFY